MKRKHTTAERLQFVAVVILGVILCALLLSSCKTAAPIVTPPASTDSTRVRVEVRVDSVWRDRWHTQYVKGDTIFVRDSITTEKTRYIDRHDTLCVRDSVPYLVEIPKPYRERNAYDKATARGFWVLLSALVLLIAARIVWRVYLKK